MNENKFCTNCGSEIEPHYKVCTNCGKKLTGFDESVTSNSDGENRYYESTQKINNMKSDIKDYMKKSYSTVENISSREKASLFKRFLNFDIFITTSILKGLYIMLNILAIISIPIFIIISLYERNLGGLIIVLLVPLGMLLLRIYFELIIALLKLVENTNFIKTHLEEK